MAFFSREVARIHSWLATAIHPSKHSAAWRTGTLGARSGCRETRTRGTMPFRRMDSSSARGYSLVWISFALLAYTLAARSDDGQPECTTHAECETTEYGVHK